MSRKQKLDRKRKSIQDQRTYKRYLKRDFDIFVKEKNIFGVFYWILEHEHLANRIEEDWWLDVIQNHSGCFNDFYDRVKRTRFGRNELAQLIVLSNLKEHV